MMTKTAGKLVSLTELRFRPANSNDAARAVIAHHFAEVPHCAFARDDGISPYLGSETGMGAFPGAPDVSEPDNTDIPAIQTEAPEMNGSLRRRLMRAGFALSVFLHGALAVAVGIATLTVPEDPPQEEGMMSVALVTQGDVEAHIAGAEEDVARPKKPAEAATKPIEKPVTDAKSADPVKPVKKVGALPTLPNILTEDSKTETEAVSPDEPAEQKPDPIIEKPVEPKPIEKRPDEKQRPVEKKVEPIVEQHLVQPVEQKTTERQEEKPAEEKRVETQLKEEPKPAEKKKDEKEKPEPEKKELKKKPTERQNRQENHGNRGEQQNERHKGDAEAKDKGPASTSSKGASKKPETGNAAETNYRGLVSRKLSRAKGRMPSPANGKLWVTFTVLSDGSISGLSVTRSSGKPAVDAIALKIVRAASPFPPIPAEAGRKSWKMTVPMTFRGG